MKQALLLLWRDWRGRELSLLLLSVGLAIALVNCVSLIAERLDQTLLRESNSFLASDRLIESNRPIDASLWSGKLGENIQSTSTLGFASMSFAGDKMQLAAVKAVAEGYPLRGRVELNSGPGSAMWIADGVPAPGEVWLDPRLRQSLNIGIGDKLEIGNAEFTVSAFIIAEPDRGSLWYGARAMINLNDVDSTGAIGPGSRVTYKQLFAGDGEALATLFNEMKPQLSEHEEIKSLEDEQPRIARSLDNAKRFLLLAGGAGVILAGIVIALSAQEYARRHSDYVAIMKTLGVTRRVVRRLYLSQFAVIWVVATALGLLIGHGVEAVLLQVLKDVLPATLAEASLLPDFIGAITGAICLLAFAVPHLWQMAATSPMRVLRRDWEPATFSGLRQFIIGMVAVIVLVWWYSGDWRITLSMVAGLAVIYLGVLLLAALILKVGRAAGMQAGSRWRLAMAGLSRRRGQTLLQLAVVSLVLTLSLMLWFVRTSLLAEWQDQMPADTPNTFLVNINPDNMPAIRADIEAHQFATEDLYPIVRGRLVSINGAAFDEEKKQNVNALNRELSLTWSASKPAHNQSVEGQWWAADIGPDEKVISVEKGLAERLGLKLGDTLGFSINSLEVDARIVHFRSVEWESMKPNFYVIFDPNTLKDFGAMYMTAVKVPEGERSWIATISQAYPTMIVIDVEQILQRLQAVISSATLAIEILSLAILAMAILVVIAAINSSMGARLHESALLRTLGASRRLLQGSVVIEFAVLGIMAGILAAAAAELAIFALQYFVFDGETRWHFWLWWSAPLAGGFLICAAGVLACRPVVKQPPMVLLRRMENV